MTGLVTGFFVLKAVQLGLRWQFEIKHEQKPTMEVKIPNPIEPIIQSKQEKETSNLLNEWLNGPPEKG